MAKVIMTVDDSASIRQMVSFTLKQGGYHVMEAVDGKDALQKLSGNKVDMLITDLNMPNLDGIGLIKGARALPSCKFIPIVMLTTESQDSRKQEEKAAGAAGWIVNPMNVPAASSGVSSSVQHRCRDAIHQSPQGAGNLP